MSTIRIALLAAGLVASAATLQAQTPPSGGPTPSARTAPDADKTANPTAPATQGVGGSSGTQSGADPAGAGKASGPLPQGQALPPNAVDTPTAREGDKSNATQGVPAGTGAQGGAEPVKPADASGVKPKSQ